MIIDSHKTINICLFLQDELEPDIAHTSAKPNQNRTDLLNKGAVVSQTNGNCKCNDDHTGRQRIEDGSVLIAKACKVRPRWDTQQ